MSDRTSGIWRPHGWTLVGRDEEMSLASDLLEDPRANGLVLSGAAGVGKTRLVREVCRLAESRGMTALWAVATESASTIPFGALAHLLPPGVPRAPPVDSPGNVLGQVGEALLGPIRAGMGLLAVDDAHLLDDGSAAALRYLVTASRAFILVSVRTGEPAPDAVQSLWREEVPRVEVQHLSRSDTEHLIESVLEDPVEAGTLHRLWDASRGRPLHVRELLLGGLESGALVDSDGVWVWRGAIVSSPRVALIVENRLRGLGADERYALEVVAVADQLEISTLEEAVSVDIVDLLERRGFLEVHREGRRTSVGLAHPLHGEFLTDRLSTARGRQIRRLLASAVEHSGSRRSGDLLRATRWRLDAGSPVPSPLALEAARQAVHMFDFTLAERLALEVDHEELGEQANEVLAQALIGQGRYLEGDRVLVELELAVDSDTALARVASTRAWNQFWHLGDATEAEGILKAAERSITDSTVRGDLSVTMANVLLFEGRVRESASLIERLSERVDLSPGGIVGLSLVGAPTYFLQGKVAKAREMLALGGVTAAETAEASILLEGNRGITEMWAGNLDLAVESLEAVYLTVVEARADPLRGMFAFLLGMCLLEKGLAESGLHRLQEARAALSEIDPLRHMAACLAETGYALALLGRLLDAERTLEMAESHRLPSFQQDLFYLQRGRWWLAAARGERSRAVALALETAETTGALGQVVQHARALHDALRLGAHGEAASALLDLRSDTDSPLILAYADHAEAISKRRPEGHEVVSKRFEEMGAYLHAAEASATAAQLYDHAGLRGRYSAAASRALALAGRCEGARTPMIVDSELSVPLTPRQREVAALAASGQSNHEIAERLVISLRTVENHLHTVYEKLGIAGRTELGAILTPTPKDRKVSRD